MAPVPRNAMDALEGRVIELKSPAMIARAPAIRRKPSGVPNPDMKAVRLPSPVNCVYVAHGAKSPISTIMKPIQPR